MPSFEEDAPLDGGAAAPFSVISQKVDLDIDFAGRRITGSTQLVVQPLTKDLKDLRLNCRQCRVSRATVEGKPAPITYSDPYVKIKARKGGSNIHQYEYVRRMLAPHVKDLPDPELYLALPPRVPVHFGAEKIKIQDVFKIFKIKIFTCILTYQKTNSVARA